MQTDRQQGNCGEICWNDYTCRPWKPASILLWLLQSLPRLKELEESMNQFFESHKGSAGAGLCLLPGVHQILSALKVMSVDGTAKLQGTRDWWSKAEYIKRRRGTSDA